MNIRPQTASIRKIPAPSAPASASAQEPLIARADFLFLNNRGEIEDRDRPIPLRAPFLDAFSTFSHGTLMPTPSGPVAVEDLLPGDSVLTENGGPQTLLWKGSWQTTPHAGTELIRVAADAFGDGFPSRDMIFGLATRVIRRHPAVQARLGMDKVSLPLADLIDSIAVVGITPPRPITLCHLLFDRHHSIRACGLEVESYHPGPLHRLSLSQELRAIFLGMFPHLGCISDLDAPRFTRFSSADLELLEVS